MMNKKYSLIIIISFVLMVFQFLLSKELLFLRDMGLFRIVIPLVLIGYSAGSALSKIKLFRTHFNIKILIAISSAIVVSAFILVRILVLEKFSSLICHFLGLIWPFIFFGIYFGRVYSETEDLRKVFLANGFGLMLGALFSGKIFRFMEWEGGLLFICLLLLLFAFFFEKVFKKMILSVIFITVLVFHFNLFSPDNPISFGFSFFAPDGKIVETENTELVRTDLVKTKDGYSIFTDGDAPTPVCYNPNAYFTEGIDAEICKDSFPNIPYIFRKYDNVLIIGTGGGCDLANAVRADASNIVGIELNPVTVSLMKEEFKQYSGGIYFHPAVKIINEEGRSYVQNTRDSYDLIVLLGTDTGTTSSFVSSTTLESYLYTKEAIKRYWEALSDRGILFICRGLPKMVQHQGLLEILKIYKAAEEGNFSKDVKKHIVIIKSEPKEEIVITHNILLSKTKFTKNEYAKLSSTSQQILHFPGIKDEIRSLWMENSKFFNLAATSDNKPSHYNFDYWQSEIHGLLFIVVPLLFLTFLISFLRKDIGISKGIFFVLLGIGYIAVEISIAEKMLLFLRNPAYSMQIVLSSFLLFGGLGGYFGASLKKGRIGLHSWILFLAIILYVGIFNLLYKYQLPNSQTGRIIFSFLLIGPISFLTAIPFAIALSREEKRHIMYAIDAVGTTVGTFIIFFLHKHFGFNIGFAWAAFIYLMLPFFLKDN